MTEVVTTLEDIIVYGYTPPTPLAGGGGSGDWHAPATSREEVEEQAAATYTASCAQATTMDSRIDNDFLIDKEGGNINPAYPPPTSNSGVTIGVGVDLGARNVQDLRNLHLANPLINILTPYLGKKGQVATDYLALHPLTLTPTALAALNKGVFSEIFDGLWRTYDAVSSFEFWRLPSAIQTVMADVAFQYGAKNLATATPNSGARASMVDGRMSLMNSETSGMPIQDVGTRRRTS